MSFPSKFKQNAVLDNQFALQNQTIRNQTGMNGKLLKGPLGDEEQMESDEDDERKLKDNSRKLMANQLDLQDVESAIKVDAIQNMHQENIEWILNQIDAKKYSRTTNYIENLQSGGFNQISDLVMIKKLEIKQQLQESQQSLQQTFDNSLISLYIESNQTIYKILYFCLGILVGYSFMHTVQLYLESDINKVLENYSRNGLRLNQILHILCFISLTGSIHFYQQSILTVQRSIRQSSESLVSDKSTATKAMVSAACFLIAYVILVFTHITVGKVSANYTAIVDRTVDYSGDMELYKAMNIVLTFFIFIGWLASVSNTKSPTDYSNIEKSDIHDDESKALNSNS